MKSYFMPKPDSLWNLAYAFDEKRPFFIPPCCECMRGHEDSYCTCDAFTAFKKETKRRENARVSEDRDMSICQHCLNKGTTRCRLDENFSDYMHHVFMSSSSHLKQCETYRGCRIE